MKVIHIEGWDESIHWDFEQVKRMDSAKKLLKDIVSEYPDGSIAIQGSSSDPYIVSLAECTCTDYLFRNLPCKHIYCLAYKKGIIDDSTLPDLKKKKDRAFDTASEIERYKQLFLAGELTADAYVKICTALSKIK